MSEKDNHDLDDDYNDDFDDLDDFDFDMDLDPLEDNRKPVEKVVGALKSGVKSEATSKTFRDEFLKRALPKEYSSSIDAANEITSGLKDLYDTTAQETKTVARELSKLVKTTFPNAGKLVPKTLADRFNKWSAKEEGYGGYNEDHVSASIAAELSTIFGERDAEEEARREEDEATNMVERTVDAKRFESSQGVMIEQTRLLSRLVNYQDNILVSYQRRSLDLQMRHYAIATKMYDVLATTSKRRDDILASIAKNTGLPDFVKLRKSEAAKEQMRNRFINNALESVVYRPMDAVTGRMRESLKKGVANFGQSLKGSLDAAGGALGTMNDMGGDTNLKDLAIDMGAGSAAGWGTRRAGQWVAGKINDRIGDRPGLKRWGKELNQILTNREATIHDALKSGKVDEFFQQREDERFDDAFNDETTRGKKIKNLGQSMLDGIGRSIWENIKENATTHTEARSVTKGTRNSGLDEPALLTNRFSRTVEEVIPGYLSKILGAVKRLSGDESGEEVYKFGSMGFESRVKSGRKLRDDIFNDRMIGDFTKSLSDTSGSILEGSGLDLSSGSKDALEKELIRGARNMDGLDFEALSKVLPKGERAKFLEAMKEKYGDGIKNRSIDQTERFIKTQNIHRDLANRVPTGIARVMESLQLDGNQGLEELGALITKREDGGLDFDQDLYYRILMEKSRGGDISGYFNDAPMPGGSPKGSSKTPKVGDKYLGPDYHFKEGNRFSIRGGKYGGLDPAVLSRGRPSMAESIKSAAAKRGMSILDQIAPGEGLVERGKALGGTIKDAYGNTVDAVKNYDVDQAYLDAKSSVKGSIEEAGSLGAKGMFFKALDKAERSKTYSAIKGYKDKAVESEMYNKLSNVVERGGKGIEDLTGVELKTLAEGLKSKVPELKDYKNLDITALRASVAEGIEQLGSMSKEDFKAKGEETYESAKGGLTDAIDKISGSKIASNIKGGIDRYNNSAIGKDVNSLAGSAKDRLLGAIETLGAKITTASEASVLATNRVFNVVADSNDMDNIPFDAGATEDSKANIRAGKVANSISARWKAGKERLARLRGKFGGWQDKDGDGGRDGDWRSIMASRRAKKEQADADKTKANKDGKKPKSMMGMLLGLLGPAGFIGKSLLSMAGMAASFAKGGAVWLTLKALRSTFSPKGFIGTALRGLGKNGWIYRSISGVAKLVKTIALSNASKGLLKGGMKGLGRLGKFVGKGMGKSTWGAVKGLGKFAGKFAKGAAKFAGRSALWAGKALLTTPIGLAVTGIALAAIGGYLLYKYLKNKKNYLVIMRMLQYGVPNKSKYIDMIDTLEQSLIPHVKMPTNKKDDPTLKSDLHYPDYFELFGIREDDTVGQERWMEWYEGRFKPVFFQQLKAMFGAVLDYRVQLKPADLTKLDEKTPNPEVKLELIIRGAVPDEVTDLMVSPFPAKDLVSNSNDVKRYYDTVLKNLQRDIAKSDLPALVQYEIDEAGPNDDNQTLAAARKLQQNYMPDWVDVSERGNENGPHGQRPGDRSLTRSEKADLYNKQHSNKSRTGHIGYNNLDGSTQDVGKDGWVWPIAEGRISSKWGSRIHPITGRRTNHNGIDVAAPEGTPIYAAKDGVIFRREYSESYGNVIYIRHADGSASRYAHMHSFAPGLMNGDSVVAGQVIGYVGNTGKSAGNHLHFEIRRTDAWDSDTVDPLALINEPVVKEMAKKAEDEERLASNKQDERDFKDDDADPTEGIDTLASTATGKADPVSKNGSVIIQGGELPKEASQKDYAEYQSQLMAKVNRDSVNYTPTSTPKAPNPAPEADIDRMMANARRQETEYRVTQSVAVANNKNTMTTRVNQQRQQEVNLANHGEITDILSASLDEHRKLSSTLEDIKADVGQMVSSMLERVRVNQSQEQLAMNRRSAIDNGAGDLPMVMR